MAKSLKDSEILSQHLARNIDALRRKRGLSQGQLAKSAGIPRSTLTHFESGAGNPSLANLARIATALGVGIEELLSRPRNEILLLKREEIPVQKRSQGTVTTNQLLPDSVRGLQMGVMEMQAGAVMGGHPHLNGAKEYLHCLQGEILVRVAGEEYRVARGSVLAFPGDQPHSYENTGGGKSQALSVVIPQNYF